MLSTSRNIFDAKHEFISKIGNIKANNGNVLSNTTFKILNIKIKMLKINK
jgi:hypothetical protein